ncbi:MAG: DUF2065 domain-containing protein [Burkholderiaceae bacterium]
MGVETLVAAVGLVLIFEGLMPFLSPVRWREVVSRIAELKDGQIRFMGLVAVVIGLIIVLL